MLVEAARTSGGLQHGATVDVAAHLDGRNAQVRRHVKAPRVLQQSLGNQLLRCDAVVAGDDALPLGRPVDVVHDLRRRIVLVGALDESLF